MIAGGHGMYSQVTSFGVMSVVFLLLLASPEGALSLVSDANDNRGLPMPNCT